MARRLQGEGWFVHLSQRDLSFEKRKESDDSLPISGRSSGGLCRFEPKTEPIFRPAGSGRLDLEPPEG